MIDTTNWMDNNALFAGSTQAINAYVNNVTNGYTLSESSAQQGVSSHQEWRCGIKTINHPGVTIGIGKSVRPQQGFIRQLSGGGHVHFRPNVESIRLYGNYVEEGGDVTTVPTGVIGIGIEMYRLSSVAATTNFENGNDAEVELDIFIFDASNPNNYAKLENYPISTTGLGTNWDPHGISQILWRGALGNSRFDRTFLFHNTQSNAWSWANNWSVGNLFNDSGKIVVGYRIHDVVSPYVLSDSVVHQASGTDVLSQQGIYAASTGMEHALEPSGSTIRLAGSPHLSFVDGSGTNHALVPHGSPIRLSEDNEPLFTTGTRHDIEPVGALGIGPSSTVQFSGTVQLSPVGAIGIGPGRGSLTKNGRRVDIGTGTSGGGGFIPVVVRP